MKYSISFGVQGGAHVDRITLPNQKQAIALASGLVQVFCNDPCVTAFLGLSREDYTRNLYWGNSTHFVALIPLLTVNTGPRVPPK